MQAPRPVRVEIDGFFAEDRLARAGGGLDAGGGPIGGGGDDHRVDVGGGDDVLARRRLSGAGGAGDLFLRGVQVVHGHEAARPVAVWPVAV